MTWLARIERARAEALLALRGFDVDVAFDAEHAWVRASVSLAPTSGPAGASSSSAAPLERALARIVGLELLEPLHDAWLVRRGATVPHARVPELAWQPLRVAWTLRAPRAALPALVPGRPPLTLVRARGEQPVSAVLVARAAWCAWCVGASELRLGPLEFAASSDGHALVRGAPPPPLPGTALWGTEGLVLPVGLGLSPPLAHADVARRLALARGDLALFTEAGLAIVPGTAFVRATRAAARATGTGEP